MWKEEVWTETKWIRQINQTLDYAKETRNNWTRKETLEASILLKSTEKIIYIVCIIIDRIKIFIHLFTNKIYIVIYKYFSLERNDH